MSLTITISVKEHFAYGICSGRPYESSDNLRVPIRKINPFGEIQHTFFPVGFSEGQLNEICPSSIHDLTIQ